MDRKWAVEFSGQEFRVQRLECRFEEMFYKNRVEVWRNESTERDARKERRVEVSSITLKDFP